MKISLSRRRVVVAVAGVVVLALVAGVVLAYPAWSARRGDDARWVVDSDAAALLDYDDERLLAVDSGTGRGALLVLDRETGEERHAGHVDARRRAALVPAGVVSSNDGNLTLAGADGPVVWEKKREERDDPEHTLLAVDTEAGVVVAAAEPPGGSGPAALVAFALADGAPVWTMPDLARIGTINLGAEPVRPPGALRANTLIPVIRVGGYPPGTAAEPATWSLVAVGSGEIAAEVVEGGGAGMPVAAGDVAVRSRWPSCADVAVVGARDVEVTWPDGPPPGDCSTVWAMDPERVLVTAWRDQREQSGGDDGVRLFSLALDSGALTELDWTGGYLETVPDRDGRDLTRSWGRYLFSRGAVYDTRTGQERWRAEEAWLAGETAVVAEPVSGVDRLVSGASEHSRWLRVADAATGEPTGDSVITSGGVSAAYVLDRGQAVVFARGEVALLAR